MNGCYYSVLPLLSAFAAPVTNVRQAHRAGCDRVESVGFAGLLLLLLEQMREEDCDGLLGC